MLTLLLFRAEGTPSVATADVAEALATVPGVELTGRAEDPYRPGGWRDEDTGARCLIDLGDPPLEQDTLHPPRAYAGWTPAGAAIHVPFAGPHWFCVEALRVVEALLKAFPDWRALDTEDVVEDDDAPPGPYRWDRPRVIANWERLRAAQIESLGGVPRMSRRASVALWRYRRERRRGRAQHPQAAWPDGAALRDAAGNARSAALWLEPSKPLAMPPVELLVVRTGTEARVVSADQAASLCEGRALDLAGATLIEPGADVDRFLAEAQAEPASAFRALGDEDWAD